MLILFIGACRTHKEPSTVEKPWTLLFYADEDYTPSYGRFQLFSRVAALGQNLNIVVLHDPEEGPAGYFTIDEDHQRVRLEELGEVNMGSSSTLHDFIAYAKSRCPAERYMLCLYDHGGGWIGACWDYTNDHDWLSPDDMQSAIRRAGGVDMIVFNGTCQMGAVETAFELREWADVYIGSENRHTYEFWDEPMGDICRLLNASPGLSTLELGEIIVEMIGSESHNLPYYRPGLTLSAVRMDKLDALAVAIDEASYAYSQNFAVFQSHLSTKYSSIRAYRDQSVDIYDLAVELLKIESDPQIRTSLEAVKTCLDAAVIAECHGEDMNDSHGLSIYFPNPEQSPYNTLYHEEHFSLDFTRHTRWDELLTAYFGILNRVTQSYRPLPPSEHLSKFE
jgi:hypothetical protein